MQVTRKIYWHVGLIAAMLLPGACNTLNGTAEKPQAAGNTTSQVNIQWSEPMDQSLPEALRQRVQQYLRQYYLRQWDENYHMQTPQNRKDFSQKAYRIYYRGGWQAEKIEVVGVQRKSPDYFIVKSVVAMRHPVHDRKKKAVMQDRWKLIDGKWYHDFYDPLINLRILD